MNKSMRRTNISEDIILKMNSIREKVREEEWSPEKTAAEILKNCDFLDMNQPIFLKEIVDAFQINTYIQEYDDDTLEGFILVSPKLWENYGIDRIISVNENISEKQRRFVMAHELGHYLFDCGQSSEYVDTYVVNHHESEIEKRANLFAASLLMPKEMFVNAFLGAMKLDVNIKEFLSERFEIPEKSVLKRMDEIFGSVNRCI